MCCCVGVGVCCCVCVGMCVYGCEGVGVGMCVLWVGGWTGVWGVLLCGCARVWVQTMDLCC